MRQAGGVARILKLTALAAIAKGPGFLIPAILAAFFGAGPQTDSYFLAYGAVLFLGGAVAQPLEATIVPFAAHALALGRRASLDFMNRLFRQGLLTGIVAAGLGGIVLWVALWIAHPRGVSPARVLTFYALLAPMAAAWCVAGLYTGSLVSAWRLELGAIGYGFRGVGALVGATCGGTLHQLWPVAIGASAGEWGRVWWLHGHWRRALDDLPDRADGTPERGLVVAAIAQMGAQGVLAAAQFLERLLVGTVAIAAISRIEYAYRIIVAAAVLFDSGVGPWLLARWANVRVIARLRSDWETVYRPLLIASVAALVVSSLIAATAPPLVEVVFHHGAFTTDDSHIVAQILRWYAVGYFFNMSALCVERLLLARVQNRMFLGLAVVRSVVRFGTVLALLHPFGVFALPVGYATGECVYLCVLLLASTVEGATVLV